MRWFGRKAGRDVARPALAHGFAHRFSAGDWPRGYDAQVREAYPLRGGDPREIEAALVAHGFLRVLEARPGDVLMLRPGAAQLHLAVRTSDGFVHADAALRQVVERPGAPDWEVLGIWRRLS